MDKPTLMKPDDFAREIQVGRTKVFAMIASGQIPSVLIGGSRRVIVAAAIEKLTKEALQTDAD